MKNLTEAVKIAADFAARARETYAYTKKWTATPSDNCETIRVPVALLNRIRDAQAETVAACAVHGQLVAALQHVTGRFKQGGDIDLPMLAAALTAAGAQP